MLPSGPEIAPRIRYFHPCHRSQPRLSYVLLRLLARQLGLSKQMTSESSTLSPQPLRARFMLLPYRTLHPRSSLAPDLSCRILRCNHPALLGAVSDNHSLLITMMLRPVARQLGPTPASFGVYG